MAERKRGKLEICAALLTKAEKGMTRWEIVKEVRNEDYLLLLLEAGMLSTDESKLNICRSGEPRNCVFKTTKKGRTFLQKYEELQNLMKPFSVKKGETFKATWKVTITDEKIINEPAVFEKVKGG